MARTYRPRADGLFEVDTPGVGYMPVHWGEDELQARGFQPYAGATAFGDTPENQNAGGTGNVPDVPREVPGASGAGGTGGIAPGSWDASMGGAPPMLPDAGAEGAPSDVATQTPTPPEAKPGAKKRPPVRTKELDLSGSAQASSGGGAGGPRYATIKGGDVRAAFRVDKGPKISPETEAYRSDAEIDTRLAMQEAADRAEERGKRNEGEYENRVLAPMERQVSSDEVKLAALRREYAKRQGAIDTERAAVDKLEVNPTELFDDKPWMMALAGVSMIAGGMLQGFQGRGNNPGMEVVQKAIDQSVQLQKDKIERRRQGVYDQETALEKLQKQYGSPELAEAELRNRQAALVEAWAKKNMLKDASDDVQLNLQSAFADRDLQRAAERQQIDTQFGDHITEEWRNVPSQTVQVGGSRPLKPEARERMVRLPDGSWGFVRDKADKAKIQDQFTSGGNVVAGLDKLQRTLEDSDLPNDEKDAAAQSIAAGLALDIKNAEQAGALDAGTQQIVGDMISNPKEWFTPNAGARIHAARERQLGKIHSIERDYVHRDPDATIPVTGAAPRSARSDE